jgi:hypothetical protein
MRTTFSEEHADEGNNNENNDDDDDDDDEEDYQPFFRMMGFTGLRYSLDF